jgi:hypothetical protein
MTKGVVFFIYGDKPTFLMTAAIWSLRTVYDGPIHVLYYQTDMDLIKRVSELPNITVSEYVPDPELCDFSIMGRVQKAWTMKAHGHISGYPFDINLYYDLDHVWYRALDMSIFDAAEEYEMVNPWFHYNKNKILRWIRSEPHIPVMKNYRTANGGCVCVKRGSTAAKEWLQLTSLNIKSGNRCLRRNPEEFALGIMLSTGQALEWPPEMSCPQGERFINEHTVACHCSRGRYFRDEVWKEQIQEAWKKDFLGMRSKYGTPFRKKKLWGEE